MTQLDSMGGGWGRGTYFVFYAVLNPILGTCFVEHDV